MVLPIYIHINCKYCAPLRDIYEQMWKRALTYLDDFYAYVLSVSMHSLLNQQNNLSCNYSETYCVCIFCGKWVSDLVATHMSEEKCKEYDFPRESVRWVIRS